MVLGPNATGFLVSARTGQVVEVVADSGALLQVVRLLVNERLGLRQTKLLTTYTDEEFLAECGRNFDGLVGKCALPASFAMKPTGSKVHQRKVKARRGRGLKSS